jgi:hypothetical protein
MASRNVLWLALGAIGLPLLVQGTGGCGFDSPAPDPVFENSYTCGCSCSASTRERAFTIAVNADDAEQNGMVVDLGGNDLDIGSQIVALRFTNHGIPGGAEIQAANVQFFAFENGNVATDVWIEGELSTDAAPFAAVDDNLSGRTPTTARSQWTPRPWVANRASVDERTSDFTNVIQELVNQPGWTTASPIVIRIAGTGQRAAIERDLSPTRAPQLIVKYAPSILTQVPVCANQAVLDQRLYNTIPQDVARADCQGRVANNLKALGGACSYETSNCACDLMVPDVDDTYDGNPGTIEVDACDDPTCALVPTNATCSNFNPNGYWQCIQNGGTQAQCAAFIAANGISGGEPVCTAVVGKPGMAARIFGNHSTCELAGTSQIEVGDREPTHDPMTVGTVDVLGDPCPGGGCRVAADIGLNMDPVTFSVRFASDPMFYGLAAAGQTPFATLSGQDAVFGANTVAGIGQGRRGATSMAVSAMNQQPLVLGIDWSAAACDLNGNLATVVDGETPDGTCAGDPATSCTADTDCADDTGPCEFEQDTSEDMTVNVALAGTLVNQPPSVSAGPDQTVECTSTAGAAVTLNGSAGDPDQNIALTSWRSGSRIGPEVGQSLTLTQTVGVGVARPYVLRVIDTFAQGDEDEAIAKVVDTTPPQLTLSVSPTQMTPPNHKLVLITATIAASDICDANPAVRVVSITSNEPDNGLGDGDVPNDIQGAVFGTDDRQFLLRRERGGTGRGRVYTITYSATDATGNQTVRQATVTVPF